jgi:hypothetical protein
MGIIKFTDKEIKTMLVRLEKNLEGENKAKLTSELSECRERMEAIGHRAFFLETLNTQKLPQTSTVYR